MNDLSRDRILTWRQTEQDLRTVYQSSAFRLPPEAERFFFEYLDANELGLAYDLLCDAMAERGAAMSAQTYDALRSIGERMEYEPRAWERLRGLVVSNARSGTDRTV